MKTHAVPLLEVVQETPRDRTLGLGIPEGSEDLFRFRPGQFLTVRDAAWHPSLKRAYSLSGSPNEHGRLRVTVRDDGKMGRHLYDLLPGARVEVSPPQGRFILEPRDGDPLVLMAGGAGVGPYRGFLRFLRESDRRAPVALVASARTVEESLFRRELERLAEEAAWFTYVPTVTREPPDSAWSGRRGRVDAPLLRSLVADPARTLLYACGPTAFVDAVVGFTVEVGLPDANVRRERWG